MSASLMVSLAISGKPSAIARGTASVDFPLPGGPDTTTNGTGTGPWCAGRRCFARSLVDDPWYLVYTGTVHRHDPQLLKGVLSTLLLHLLATRESYGYELVQRLGAAGLPDVLEGTVYPALARLERDGLVTSRLVASNAGPARKYYRPTAVGRDQLATAVDSWRTFAGVVEAVVTTPLPDAPEPGA